MFTQSTKALVILLSVLASTAVIGGIWAVWAEDTTEYIEERLVIVPGTVTTDGWSGIESVLVQDVPHDALYQAFSRENSAFISLFTDALPAADSSVEPDQVSDTSDTAAREGDEQNGGSSIVAPVADPALPQVEDTQAAAESSSAPSDSTQEGVSTAGEATEVTSDSGSEPAEEVYDSTNDSETTDTEPPTATDEPGPVESIEESTESEANDPPTATDDQSVGAFIRSLTGSLFTRAGEVFPLAQEGIEVPLPVPTPEIVEEETNDTEPATEVVTEETDEAAPPTTDAPPVTDAADVSDEEGGVSDSADVPVATDDIPASDGTTTPFVIPNDEAVESPAADVSANEPLLVPVTESPDSDAVTESTALAATTSLATAPRGVAFSDLSAELCLASLNCRTHSLRFGDFSMPDLGMQNKLTSMQLRLSMAALPKVRDQVGNTLHVVYSYGNDEWFTAYEEPLTDELSNSLNGAPFLVTLPAPGVLEDLNTLEVAVVFAGDITSMDGVYVDAVWLEVFSGLLFEVGTQTPVTDQLDYSRELVLPSLHTLLEDGLDFGLNAAPHFNLEYQSQKNFFARTYDYLFDTLTFTVANVVLRHEQGEVMPVGFDVVYGDDGRWTLTLTDVPQRLRPGIYTVEVTIAEADEIYTDSFEFYWGVLAVNSTKSMYEPGESVTLQLAALTKKGDTICDAALTLEITDPSNTIYEVPVEQTGACGDNNVTPFPDYDATFSETDETGVYRINVRHYNQAGELVHRVTDSFEVRDFIPYDIERTAPTRIYPPAPYAVTLNITANRSFTGDILERVPRGFVVTVDEPLASVATYPTHSEIIWHDVAMDEGDRLQLSYTFDAPDISPYLYRLGPLNMDGFEELRSWQIASDAVSNVAFLTGTQTSAGAELNNTSDQTMLFSTSSVDTLYFTHSTTTNSDQLIFNQNGDYFVSFTLPVLRTDAVNFRFRLESQLYLNGAPVTEAITRSGYVRSPTVSNHNESSNHLGYLLTDVSEGDYLEVFSRLLTTYNASIAAEVDGQASLYVEYIGAGETVFAATSTSAITSTSTITTNLNRAGAVSLQWGEVRQDVGYLHSNSSNPEDITIEDPGVYQVYVNIPLTAAGTEARSAVVGRVLLDGVEVPGGQLKQGYIRNTDSDTDASLHWSGVVVTTIDDQVLSITAEQEAIAGVVNITPSSAASIYIQALPSSEIIALRGTQVETNSNEWNPAAPAAIQWASRDAYDTTVFTHSTSSNPADITIDVAGDYYLVYNAAFTNGAGRDAPEMRVQVDGTAVPGATSKTAYMSGTSGHIEGSHSLSVLLEGLATSSVINLMMSRGGNTGTVDDAANAIVLLWKKAELDLRPDTFTLYDEPFDSIRFASTTPIFEFTTTDPDGSSDIQYQFSISTSSEFTSSTTRTSGVSAGFVNVTTPADTSPFTEGQQIRFALQSGDALDDETTYYWRVRARDVTGSNEYGDWSTTQSMTVDLGATTPYWYQDFDGQFETDTLVGTRGSGSDSVEVAIVDNKDILLSYAENNVTTPRYQFWNGISWGAEGSALNVGGTNINWIETAAGTTRDEYVLVTLGNDSDINAQIYTASTSSWGNLTELETASLTNTTPGIAATYESSSGDAMVVGCSSTADPVYALWNGSSWYATGTINVITATSCSALKLASHPVTDEIILVHKGTGDSYEAQVWDGAAWGDSIVLGLIGTGLQDVDVIYEESGDQAMVVTADAGDNEFVYSTWDGTAWSTVLPIAHDADFENGILTRDQGTDQIALCLVDSSTDIQVVLWDGDAWGSYREMTNAGNSATGRPVDCEFETAAGRDGYLVVPYSDGTDDQHQTYDGSTWSGELAGSDLTDGWFVQTARAGDGSIVAIHMIDQGTTGLYSSQWNGSSWSNSAVRETLPAGITPNPRLETFSLSAKQYIVGDGTVRTNPIDFSFVPNQPTWGDISFTFAEPTGTNGTVQVYYSNVGTCDTLVPDIALPGNSSGFSPASSPIDISSLSTTTYDELCIEAAIDAVSGNSANLTQWSVSWVREPKLIQNNFRWYTNLSALTPTDVWPAGSTDLAENEAVTPETAISDGEEIRLRMSVQGSNVDLATSSETFVLQYAENPNSCSLATDWSDVGEIGSSTTLWRGYANTIAGDDWFDEDWGRRIEITIDSTDVDDDVTDFPVYVDLSTLPSGFFSRVQSDGDDIRVTTGSGTTSVPFELVAINTGLETGELHFKAPTLSSTTDTTFFIYYDNPAASGYAASATYGSQNVWTNSYEMRFAMDDDPTYQVSAVEVFDSTSNSNDANTRSTSGMTAGDVVTGQLGQALNFDGNDGALFESILTFTGPFTISMWWRTQNYVDSDGFAVASNDASANEKIGPWTAGNAFVRTIPASTADNAVAHPADTTWTHVVVTRDTSNKIDLHFNGVTTRLHGDAARSGNSNWYNFGGDPTQGFEGDLDELRFADVRRTNGWITTEYANQANPSGFYSVSSEQLISDGRELPSVLLSESDFPETYEEENPTRENLNAITIGTDVEWDFVLENNGAAAGTEYCFRLVYENGGTLSSYAQYPELVTNGPPGTPTLFAPFDNEQLASTSPWFEFVAEDPTDDDVSYQIQIDADYTFATPDVDQDSVTNFVRFENIANPSDKNPFDSGQTIRYIPTATLTDGTTYYWRVRAQDPDNSGTYGEWSTPSSFTVVSGTVITTWFQTTDEQFDTNDLEQTEFSGTDSAQLQTGQTLGTTTSTAIEYADVDTGNAWGSFNFNDTLNGGTITYFIEYLVSGSQWARIPASDLPGNDTGYTSGPVTMVQLDTDVYHTIRVVAVHEDTGGNPDLDDWTVTWGERVETPALTSPFDNAKVATTTPTLVFSTTDPDGDALQYQVQFSTTSTFTSSSTFLSGVNSGFADVSSSSLLSPYPSGDTISYTFGTPLTSSSTYWWRVRARDPGGDDVYSLWSDPFSFTVDESITVSTWFQTTGEQFDTDTLSDIETTLTEAQITTTIRETMVVYSELGSFLPKYRLWSGTAWGDELTAQNVNAYLLFSELEANPTRDEYVLATLGDDSDLNVQVYNGASSTWGNLLEITDNMVEYSNGNRPFDIAYEQVSGNLILVACAGTDAMYAEWDGMNWTGTTSIPLANANECRWVQLAADPVSNEIIAGFRHLVNDTGGAASPIEYEFLVWDGSAWSDSNVFGQLNADAAEAMAIRYEASGNEAMVITGDRASNQVLYDTWDGATWTGGGSVAIGNDFRWGTLAHDDGTDKLLLCTQDANSDMGTVEWNGSAWGTHTEHEQGSPTALARPFSCEYMTDLGTDGDALMMYANNTEGLYQEISAGVPQGQQDIGATTDRANSVVSVRSGDGVVIAGYNEADNPDSYRLITWDGSAWTEFLVSNTASDTAAPFTTSLALAARQYPDFTSGTIRSTTIDFDDGTGPRWEAAVFTDTLVGASSILYQVYYNTGSAYALVPDLYLPGNSVGTTSGQVDLSALNRTLHNELQLNAQFTCVAGNCPILNDWTVRWAEGITVSGVAYAYDQSTPVTSGTVKVVVNGVEQTGKTGTILGDGSWEINNVTVFEGDTLMVFIDNVVDAEEALAVTTFDGDGDVSGMVLSARHMTIGSNDETVIVTNAGLAGYDYTDDDDVFYSIDGSNVVVLCGDVGCADNELTILADATYAPGANTTVHDVENNGILTLGATTFRVNGSLYSNATVTPETSTVLFTATTSTETITFGASSTADTFNNLTFGEATGTATWTVDGLDVDGTLSVQYGTLARGTTSITVGTNLAIGANGAFSGLGTTTFDGTGIRTWTDNSASSTNIGYVAVDGTSKTVTVSSNVRAERIWIGADDVLRGGTGNTLYVETDFVNTNSFVADSSTVNFSGTTTAFISHNNSSFYNLAFSGIGGDWSFTTPIVTVSNNLTIATGTVTLPTATTTIGGSFINSGGTFLHNNGVVRMTSTAVGRTITTAGTEFLNAFYRLVFAGSGAWTFADSATTSEDFLIQAGSVTLPADTLTVTNDFRVTGGSFAHNSGTVVLLVGAVDTVTTNGSSFYNLSTRTGGGSSWYNEDWTNRIAVTIDADAIDDTLTNFPVFVDLADLPAEFFTGVKADGGDIRVTEANGTTLLPLEVVSINTATEEGELHFRATSLSSTTDTTFYIYYGNAATSTAAATSQYGENAVWSNGFTLVHHLDDLTTSTNDNSEGTPDGAKTSANNPLEVSTGKVYEAQDFSGDSIGHQSSSVMASQNDISFSAWVNADNLTGSGDTATFGYSIFGITPTGNPYTWLTAGGTGFTDEFRICAWENVPTNCTGTTGADIATGEWIFVSVVATDGGATTVRVNGTQRLSYTNAGTGVLGDNFTIGDLRPTRNINWDGRIDEVRVANVTRTAAWQDATYRNQATTTDFYTASGEESQAVRTFGTTNTTVLNDLTLETGGDAIFPSGTLSIGGSFLNAAEFDANSGTVRFNSTDTGETIDPGVSEFATLTFDSTTGGFTVTDHATATVAIALTNASDWTLQSGRTLTTEGTFTNSVGGASTTWTGATLHLAGGTDFALNSKTVNGDTYATLRITGDGDVSMWNSTSTTYTLEGTSSLYSQDHNGANGELYIFGDYVRSSGTEHWSYATDFDGADISGTPRAATVRIRSGDSVTINGGTLSIQGSSTASTTVTSQSGTYSMTVSGGTVNAAHYTFTNMDASGVVLSGTPTVTSLDDGLFTITTAAGTGIRLSSTTINANPSKQLYRVNFATTSAIAASNVTLAGGSVSTSYWWFRDSIGNISGETFDASDGNPGDIRWDDSSYLIDISGVLYDTDGVTPYATATAIRLLVDGDDGAPYDTTTTAGTGAFTVSNVAYIGDPVVTVFLNTNGAGPTAALVTKTPTTDITDLRLIVNRVVTRHEDVLPLSIEDLAVYDNTDDSDLRFTAATGSPDALVVLAETELWVASSTTFAPSGTVTLQSGGSGEAYDGSLHLDDDATLTGASGESYSIGGSLFIDSGATFTVPTSTVTFTATTTGKTITSEDNATLTFSTLTFSGVGGEWNLNTDLIVNTTMTVATGTVTGTGDLTLQSGGITGDGLLSLGGGVTTIESSSILGGIQGWTFYNLVLGDGSTVGTTTRTETATTTILNQFTIAAAHYFDLGSATLDLAGTGTVFVENGTFIEDTSTVVYSGGGAAAIRSTPYYNLRLTGYSGAPVYTFGALGVSIQNDLTVGGSTSTIATLATSDPVVTVAGNVFIDTLGSLVASETALLTVSGSWDNNGTFTNSGGRVTFDSTDAFTIAAGTGAFGSTTISGVGAATITEAATSTGRFIIGSSSDLTVNPGVSLAVGGILENRSGGAATEWTGSTLFLYGGKNYTVNPKSVSDTYDTLLVGTNTDVRLWGSSASTTSVDTTGSLYSQDHAGNAGDLYVYGSYVRSTGADYWSYATDFDGTDLTGGGERDALVYLADGASATWSGGTIEMIGGTGASTTVAHQSTGNYTLVATSTATVEVNGVVFRDLGPTGFSFGGTVSITDFSNTDQLADTNGDALMTVAGSVITANPGKNFDNNIFSAAGGVVSAVNVDLVGSTLSAWRFTGHSGDLDGEFYDSDSGDPGEIIWDDSTPIFTISGRVYEANRTATSSACDGVTKNIFLAIDGSTVQSASTSCAVADGSYSLSNISFDSNDVLTVFINDEAESGVTVSVDSVGSVGNMDIYEQHVIVRHESANPITIADLAVFDFTDDDDAVFTAVDGGSDTVSIPSDHQLLIWTNKEFEPLGNVTLVGGGSGASYDGSLEALSGATFTVGSGESHAVGGSAVFGTSASLDAASSTITMTSASGGRTVDVNGDSFHTLAFTGSGSWTVSDPTLTTTGSLLVSGGSLTLPTGTTTIASEFINSATVVPNGSPLAFTSTNTNRTITLGGMTADSFRFDGIGSWAISDTDATSTGSFIVATGTVTLPAGVLAIGRDFINSDTVLPNSGLVALTATTGSATITLSGSDLHSLEVRGAIPTTMTDESATLLGDLTILAGTFTVPSTTLSIGGSLDATTGTFIAASSTFLFNSADTGETIAPGANEFYNLTLAGATGGWTLQNATTTNNFSLTSAASFTLQSADMLVVNGVFTNTVGGSATTWTGSTLRIATGENYTGNTKLLGGDRYQTLDVRNGTDLRFWNSAATTTLIETGSTLYSQDHAGSDGALSIFGAFTIATSTEYWNYATDFDGTVLTGGSRRPVTVSVDPANATSSVTLAGPGTLQAIGAVDATTTIQSASSSITYPLFVSGGTLNATYFSLAHVDANGLNLTGVPIITALSPGLVTTGVAFGNGITLSSTTLAANAAKTFDNVGFDSAFGGNNITLVGTTSSAWRFTNSYGNRDGEDFDGDGGDDCGSIRWDDSSCLLVQQSDYRWRNDDGGEGAPDSEWYAVDWSKRKRVRLENNDATAYATTAAKFTVAYDADMQSDFEDLRFTRSDGVTVVPHWIERYTASTDALVWVQVPDLPASGQTDLHMYYGNVVATTTSSSTLVFNVADDFSDGSILDYDGDTGLFTVDGSFAYSDTLGLDNTGFETSRATDGIYNTDVTVAQGEVIRYRQYVSTASGAGNNDEVCTLFGVQTPGSNSQNYAVCIEQFGTDRLVLVQDAESTDTFGSVTILDSTNVTLATGWYEVVIDWQTDDTIDVSLHNAAGTVVATTSAVDGTYTSGGIGFTYWGNYGGWDSYLAYDRITTPPSVRFGNEQVDGGATWVAAQNTPGTGFDVGETARLRLAIENTGLAITDQEFELEFAPKGTALSCEAVSESAFVAVPPVSSCNTSGVCMATSTTMVNDEATTDLLEDTLGTFVAGRFVEDPDNQTTVLDVDQDEYVELEYALEITINATDDAYCFRVSDNGTPLDSYDTVAELSLQFDPVIGSVQFNGGLDIELTGGTTTRIYATTSVIDLNGFADLVSGTSTFYTTAAGATCTADNNNCYISDTNGQCEFTNCSGTSCVLSCYADMYFHADPTDDDLGALWYAFLEVEDSGGGYDQNTNDLDVEVLTLRALSVDSGIDYGSIAPESNTGSYNASTTIVNIGNAPINISVEGTDLSDGGSSAIPADQQKFASSTFTYSGCGFCQTVSSTVPVPLNIAISKPTATSTPQTDDVYWGIAVPFGINSAPHQGINTIYAISI